MVGKTWDGDFGGFLYGKGWIFFDICQESGHWLSNGMLHKATVALLEVVVLCCRDDQKSANTKCLNGLQYWNTYLTEIRQDLQNQFVAINKCINSRET